METFKEIFGFDMNNFQREVLAEYFNTGQVWGEYPRQCGKTTIITYIAIIEYKLGNYVFIKTLEERKKRILNLILKYGYKNFKFVDDEKGADILLYDEYYYDLYDKPNWSIKIVSLMTRLYPTRRRNYDECDNKKYVEGINSHLRKDEEFQYIQR